MDISKGAGGQGGERERGRVAATGSNWQQLAAAGSNNPPTQQKSCRCSVVNGHGIGRDRLVDFAFNVD